MSKFIVMSAIEGVGGKSTLFDSNAVGLNEADANKEAKRRTAAEKKAGRKDITWFPAPDMSEMLAAAGVKPARKPRAKKVETLTEDQATEILDRAGEEVDLATVVKETKKRRQSAAERGDDGKVVRTGRNLSGNQPFRAKLYYYDLDAKSTPDYAKAFNAAPNQVRLMMSYMEDEGITTADDAMRGGEICGGAINSGKLASKIEPAALFAYYRRVMETLGLTLANA